ncbi:quinone oxidoreductase family protein [Actinoallomurus sp. CA-142502]|uniref:quinone oxidoreductase family protein n=1 Tax=Actinoallomurus sp. CA-142502 TaxID=3239885 RepID=UPI003D8A83C4
MRALVMTGPSEDAGRTTVLEVEEPHPGAGEVTVEVEYAGINFIDVMARRGDPGYAKEWPYRPGLEVSGTVREVGPGVTGLDPGRRVAAFTGGGGLAEVVRVPAASVVPVPGGVPSPVAAAAPLMLTTGLLLLRDAARFRPGETVLVHSAGGGVGGAVARLVPALGGGRLIGTVGRPAGVGPALESGYDAVVPRDAGLEEAIRAATGGTGVDVVLDPLGTRALRTDLAVAAPGGRIVLFGNAGGGEQDALPAAGRLIGGNLSIGGFSMSGLWAHATHRAAAGLREVLGLVADGTLDLPVTEAGALAEVPEIHQLLAEGRGRGKYVVRPGA